MRSLHVDELMETEDANWLDYYVDWLEWAEDNLAAGSQPQDVMQIMLQGGVPAGVAQRLMESTGIAPAGLINDDWAQEEIRVLH
ncbi:hypothetical protein [Silvimonas amylolytica]|uniref:Uncharacterized protein n=1 Tax=Silvimonas amylolytica TaxID=449663 RepID=A0ABQ2PIG8_9NEIS|nr:hypothetical protein [Silvimonas amylolytica]GGP25393.1 hypothetical protein GCM10010971_12120 [Silvimonas amylolytica]